MTEALTIIGGLILMHLFFGLMGLDVGTFELLKLFLGNRKALDIWWADWFYSTYILSHIILGFSLIGIAICLTYMTPN